MTIQTRTPRPTDQATPIHPDSPAPTGHDSPIQAVPPRADSPDQPRPTIQSKPGHSDDSIRTPPPRHSNPVRVALTVHINPRDKPIPTVRPSLPFPADDPLHPSPGDNPLPITSSDNLHQSNACPADNPFQPLPGMTVQVNPFPTVQAHPSRPTNLAVPARPTTLSGASHPDYPPPTGPPDKPVRTLPTFDNPDLAVPCPPTIRSSPSATALAAYCVPCRTIHADPHRRDSSYHALPTRQPAPHLTTVRTSPVGHTAPDQASEDIPLRSLRRSAPYRHSIPGTFHTGPMPTFRSLPVHGDIPFLSDRQSAPILPTYLSCPVLSPRQSTSHPHPTVHVIPLRHAVPHQLPNHADSPYHPPRQAVSTPPLTDRPAPTLPFPTPRIDPYRRSCPDLAR